MRNTTTATLVLLSIALALVGCARLTRANFDRIEEGMSYSEVVGILGEPDDSKSVGFGPLSASTATWEDDQALISIQFVNERVKVRSFVSKSGDR